MSSQIPPTYRGLLVTSASTPAQVTSIPTPALTPSTVLIRPIITNLVSYISTIFGSSNSRGYSYPVPLVPGAACIGRILSAASDLPSLKPGQLVFVDPVVRARDGSGVKILHALNGADTETGRAMMEGEWRDGSFGEIVRVPAENVHPLDEERLLSRSRGLGYAMADLGYLASLLVAYGGLRDVDVRPGELVLVAPATGSFGGAAVHVALALGADVIAMGRNEEILNELEVVAKRSYPAGRLKVLKMTGGLDGDMATISAAARELGSRRGTVDVYFDISPPNAGTSSHIKAGVLSLRPHGRMSLMGGAAGDVGFPYFQIMRRGLTLKGTFMYAPEQIDELIKLVETGKLKLGREAAGAECVGVYGLEEWEEAFRKAGEEGRMGRFALLAPNGKGALL